MKILVIITGNWGLDALLTPHIQILSNFMKSLSPEHIVEYAGISCYDDFHNYENIVHFKYKKINTDKILTRLVDFIITYKDELDYDWFIRIRPEVHLLENIPFDTLCMESINARARVYYGKKRIQYGLSTNGEGMWNYIRDCELRDEEQVYLDDMLIIFHRNNLDKFVPYLYSDYPSDYNNHNEWAHDTYYKDIHITKNVIGINMIFRRKEGHYAYSGNINC
jgi:hypothetical protein